MGTKKDNNTANPLPELSEGVDGLYKQFLDFYIARKLQASWLLNDFKPHTKWISKRLRITQEDAMKALKFLESIGIISSKGNDFKLVQDRVSIKASNFGTSFEDFSQQHRLTTHQLLNDVNQNDRRFFYNGFFASDDETYFEFHKKVVEAKEQFIESSKLSKRNKVFGYSFTCATVSELNSLPTNE